MGKFIARCVLDNETSQDGFNPRDLKAIKGISHW